MSKYTTELRYPLLAGYTLFDFDYPIWDKAYKPVLENKIIQHFYFREIGQETWERFKHYLEDTLLRIMPYYIEVFETTGILTPENYQDTYDMTTEHELKKDENEQEQANHNESSQSQSNSQEVFSDTPQSQVGAGQYATNKTTDDDTGQSSSDANDDSNRNLKTTEHYIETIKGSSGMGSAPQVLKQWRETLTNIDQNIIDDLESLFMGVY